MQICVIINQNAGAPGQSDALLAAAEAHGDMVCWMSEEAGDGIDLARRAADEGFDVVAAAGGDGTVNEVVNGLMSVEPRPVLGVLPLGTGNDFARMLDLPLDDPAAALDVLATGKRRRMDVFHMQTQDIRRFGINAAAGGFSGQVDEALTTELKESWGPLAYLIGAASALPDLTGYETYLQLDDDPTRRTEALNIMVANGRTIGGGKRVAPLANPEDGRLDVVVVKYGTPVELADAARRLVAGDLAECDIVEKYRARRIRVESDPGMWFNLDGELMTKEPVEIVVEPSALEVAVDGRYRSVVEL